MQLQRAISPTLACMLSLGVAQISTADAVADGKGASSPPIAASPAPQAECRKFVQAFYSWYLKQPQADRAYSHRSSDFSAELLSQLQEDYRASKKHSDEVVGLDFDPFLATQDQPHAKYVVSRVTPKSNGFLVHIDGMDGKAKVERNVVTPEVACLNGKWQFVNFHYKDAKDPADENLVSILKTLRDDRRKNGQ